jgi:hypothetical protein
MRKESLKASGSQNQEELSSVLGLNWKSRIFPDRFNG